MLTVLQTTDINDCDPDPYDNNQTSIDEVNGYVCAIVEQDLLHQQFLAQF